MGSSALCLCQVQLGPLSDTGLRTPDLFPAGFLSCRSWASAYPDLSSVPV